MKRFLQFLKGLILPVFAGSVIILALLVGVARLLLPQVPQYREDIQGLAEQATGFSVEFGQISAGVSRYGPELRLQQTRIVVPEENLEVVYAEEVKISLDMMALLFQQVVLPSHTEISGVRLAIVRTSEGRLLLQGRTLGEWLALRGDKQLPTQALPDTSLWLSDVIVGFDDQLLQRPAADFRIAELKAELDDGVLLLEGDVEPEVRFGEDIRFLAEADLLPLLDRELASESVSLGSSWSIELDIPDLDIEQWVSLLSDQMSPIVSGTGEAFIRARLRGGLPLNVEADVSLENITILSTTRESIVYERLNGQLTLERNERDWRVTGRKFVLQNAEQAWPTGRFDAQVSLDEDNVPVSFFLDVDFVSLDNLMPLAHAFIAGPMNAAGVHGTAGGRLKDVRVRGSLAEGKIDELLVRGHFTGLSYSDPAAGIDVAGITGNIDGSLANGSLELQVRNGRFELANLFRGPIDAERLAAKVSWATTDAGLTVAANELQLQTPYGSATVALELFQSSLEGAGLMLDLSASASASDVRGVIPNLPSKIPAVVLDWLQTAIISGEVFDVRFTVKGDVRRFPFKSPDDGIFKVIVPVRGGNLKFAPDWPTLEEITGELVFDGLSMYTKSNAGLFAGTPLNNMYARMPDMRTGVLDVDARVETDLPAVLRLLRESTIRGALGPIIDDVSAIGGVAGRFKLHLPIKSLADYGLQAKLAVKDATLQLKGIDYVVSNVNGPLQLDRSRFSSGQIDGRFLGEPISIRLRHPEAEEVGLTQIVEVMGTTPAPKVADALRLPFANRYTGSVSWAARALFPDLTSPASRQFEILVTSDLENAAIDLPAPLFKAPESAEPMTASIRFPRAGEFEVVATTHSGIGANLSFGKAGTSWNLQRGALSFGMGVPVLPSESGISLGGSFGRLDVADWVTLASTYAESADGSNVAKEDFLRELDFSADDLRLFGFSFPDSKVNALQIGGLWYIDIAGPWAAGKLIVPASFSADETLRADMSRLMLVDDATATESVDDETIDPLDFPSLAIKVADFSIGDLRFGALDARAVRDDRGLIAEEITTRSESFTMNVYGDWVITDPVNITPRTRIRLTLDSTDVAATLSSLGYEPLVVASRGTANADLTWNGMPGMGMVYESKGTFGFRIENGQIMNVEPGSGRLLGLLSFTSLPRRLSLDFRDVFNDGLGFDKLKGSFRLDSGLAYTCDVAMDGSVTDMAIIGSSSLINETYDQLVVVRPHMSNVIPLGTAVVAGPAIGAAVWLVAAIFKEPLSSIGETYYSVLESWDEPKIEKVRRSNIDTDRFKNCAANLPEFSLEDLAALEELRQPQAVAQPKTSPPEQSLNEARTNPQPQ
jgi:uncharacterized protein (TIGR02099 family)